MKPPTLGLTLLLALAGPALGQTPPPPTTAPASADRAPARVVRVVDCDTIVVGLPASSTTIRLLGIDVPEFVAPGKPVEPFAREAATFLRTRVEGRTVALAFEPAGRRIDCRGRTLAWVYAGPDERMVNLEVVERGLARAYTAKPYPSIERFRRAEAEARAARLGHWGDAPAKPAAPAPATAGEAGPATVYTTDTGDKYHREGCRYLAKSSHPRDLAGLAARFTACSKCDPPARPGDGRESRARRQIGCDTARPASEYEGMERRSTGRRRSPSRSGKFLQGRSRWAATRSNPTSTGSKGRCRRAS